MVGEHIVESDKMLTRDEQLDPEVVTLCVELNKLAGIKTLSSCCGHGREPFRILFRAKRLDALPQLLFWLGGCAPGHYGWRVIAGTSCTAKHSSLLPPTHCRHWEVTFTVEGPIGEEAYRQAAEIARALAGEPK